MLRLIYVLTLIVMAISVYSTTPAKLVAGDTYHWTETPDQIAEVTSFDIVFRSIEDSDIEFTVTGSDETTNFLFELEGSKTANLDAGEYTVSKLITYSWGRESESALPCQISANPAADPSKSFNRRIVELLEQHIEGRLPEGLESHTIGGVPINKIPLTEAEDLLNRFRAKLRQEENNKRRLENPGRGSGNTVHVHFQV